MQKKRLITIVVAVLVIIVLISLIVSRGRIAERLYRRSGERIAEQLSADLRAKYNADLTYTLDKFWEFYEKGIVNRNDLSDVMEKMKLLSGKESIRDRDIFDFIAYVSRIYTDAMNEYHEKHPYFQPPVVETL
jgi:hypothetical protein